MTMTRDINTDNGLQGQKKVRQLVTGGCCQWRDSGSFDSDVHIETFVLRGKFSGKIATEQQPPIRYNQ
jgi:cytoskeletal protein CcmA (bactofilin family)